MFGFLEPSSKMIAIVLFFKDTAKSLIGLGGVITIVSDLENHRAGFEF